VTHLYAEDPAVPADHRGDGRCTCGLPRVNKVHSLPSAPPEQRQHRARYDQGERLEPAGNGT
jgi:hypothetical protein